MVKFQSALVTDPSLAFASVPLYVHKTVDKFRNPKPVKQGTFS